MKHSRPVYSTANGRLCPECGQPVDNCQCRGLKSTPAPRVDTVTIWRERKGRGGKEVSIIKGLPLNSMELQLLASSLKKHCSSGGTVSNGNIEIQGDHREKIKHYLEARGHPAKLAGG